MLGNAENPPHQSRAWKSLGNKCCRGRYLLRGEVIPLSWCGRVEIFARSLRPMAASGGWTRPVKMGRRGRGLWGHSIARLWANWRDGRWKGVLGGFAAAAIGEGDAPRVTPPLCRKAGEKEKAQPSHWLAGHAYIVGIWPASRNVRASAAGSLFDERGEGEGDGEGLILLCGKKGDGEWARSHLSVCLREAETGEGFGEDFEGAVHFCPPVLPLLKC
ncbi:putative trans-sialidase [Trypanosoma cruzi]|nr:putative trans-sialidase [Trypanosoma cruzi]